MHAYYETTGEVHVKKPEKWAKKRYRGYFSSFGCSTLNIALLRANELRTKR